MKIKKKNTKKILKEKVQQEYNDTAAAEITKSLSQLNIDPVPSNTKH